MSRRLNHSRYIDNGAGDVGNYLYYSAKATATAKQIKFYKKLYAICKEHNIDPTTNHEHTRAGFSGAIDTLLSRLKESGVDINGNGHTVRQVLEVVEDKRGRLHAHEITSFKQPRCFMQSDVSSDLCKGVDFNRCCWCRLYENCINDTQTEQ